MSATVTTGKRAAAFAAPSGRTIYVLYEQTYEKNCVPHTPRWSCVSIGGIEKTMALVFGLASECEGGMLQGRGGHISAEGYIRGWLRELAAPVKFGNCVISLKFGTDMFSDSIPADKIEFVKSALLRLGRTDLLEPLVAGEMIRLDLFAEIDVIEAICTLKGVSPWRILRSTTPYPDPCPELGYTPAPVQKFTVELPVAYRVCSDECLMRRPDGTWYGAGSTYSIVRQFVEGLWRAELKEPGSFFKRIRAYRKAIQESPELPLESVKISVDTNVSLNSRYQRESVSDFPKNYPTTQTATGYEIQATRELLSQLTRLPRECTTWHLPAAVGSLV
jgi:hypothetical protein